MASIDVVYIGESIFAFAIYWIIVGQKWMQPVGCIKIKDLILKLGDGIQLSAGKKGKFCGTREKKCVD